MVLCVSMDPPQVSVQRVLISKFTTTKKEAKKKNFLGFYKKVNTQIVSEYDQDIPQSHTTEQPTTPGGRATVH